MSLHSHGDAVLENQKVAALQPPNFRFSVVRFFLATVLYFSVCVHRGRAADLETAMACSSMRLQCTFVLLLPTLSLFTLYKL